VESVKVIQAFNRRKSWGGEDLSIKDTAEILRRNGVVVYEWIKDISDLGDGLWGKVRAFGASIYSWSSAREMTHIIESERPDVVHIHNLYPQLSPSVLVACRHSGTPVVWHPHDQRPICPTGFHLKNGSICERCCGGREYWCILRNCRNNVLESIAYAVRTYTARKLHFFHNNVTLFVVWSEFLKSRLVAGGFDERRIVVVPHPIKVPDFQFDPASGEYVGYVGRISLEKGVNVLISAAGRVSGTSVHIAGDSSRMPELVREAPGNAKFIGWLDRSGLPEFYRRCRFVVIPSVCFDVFPTVALEAMGYGIPVIGARIGGIPEVVRDGVTGLLFEPGNAGELAEKMRHLWDRPDLCTALGKTARQFVIETYRESVYCKHLLDVYSHAIGLVKENRGFGNLC